MLGACGRTGESETLGEGVLREWHVCGGTGEGEEGRGSRDRGLAVAALTRNCSLMLAANRGPKWAPPSAGSASPPT